MEKLAILIVEDEVVMAMDLERRLKKLGYRNITIRDNHTDAIHYLEIHSPDLVLCDINLFGENTGIAVAEYVRDNTKVPLIFTTAHSDKMTLDAAKKTMPYGYIVKPYNHRDLLAAIELALYKYEIDHKKTGTSPEEIDQLSDQPFSTREHEIIAIMIKGATNEQIAEAQHISINTVKFHISRILNKLNVKNRSAAISKVLDMH